MVYSNSNVSINGVNVWFFLPYFGSVFITPSNRKVVVDCGQSVFMLTTSNFSFNKM